MATLRSLPWQVSFLALGAIWGSSFLFIKLGLQSLTPVQVAFGQDALAGALDAVGWVHSIRSARSSPSPR